MPTRSTRRLDRRRVFRALQVGFAAVLTTVLVGCGQSSDGPKRSASDLPVPPGGVIAHVGAYTIDAHAFKSAFAEAIDAEPVSTRVTPIPPDFEACVDQLEGVAKRLNLTLPSRAQLKAKCSERYEATRDAVVTSLIQGLWVVGEAKALGLAVAPAVARDPAAAAGLQAESKRLAKLIGQRISEAVEGLSRSQLKAYYEGHQDLFAVPHRRDLEIVRVASKPAAKRIKREIEMGRTFASAAKGLPRQPTFGMNGFVPGYEKREFREPVLSEAIFAAKLHRVEGPQFVSPLYGYFVFEVVRDYPQHQRPFASVERKVLRELPIKLRQQRLAAFIQSWVERWRAATICKAGYVVAPCAHAQAPTTQLALEAGSAFQ
jgi:PPIC-type PPIASE domain